MVNFPVNHSPLPLLRHHPLVRKGRLLAALAEVCSTLRLLLSDTGPTWRMVGKVMCPVKCQQRIESCVSGPKAAEFRRYDYKIVLFKKTHNGPCK